MQKVKNSKNLTYLTQEHRFTFSDHEIRKLKVKTIQNRAMIASRDSCMIYRLYHFSDVEWPQLRRIQGHSIIQRWISEIVKDTAIVTLKWEQEAVSKLTNENTLSMILSDL